MIDAQTETASLGPDVRGDNERFFSPFSPPFVTHRIAGASHFVVPANAATQRRWLFAGAPHSHPASGAAA